MWQQYRNTLRLSLAKNKEQKLCQEKEIAFFVGFSFILMQFFLWPFFIDFGKKGKTNSEG